MGKEILVFRDIEIEKNKFYCHKSPFLEDVDIKILRKCYYLKRFLLMEKKL